VNFGFLLRGLPGHPLHPPLTDATIGTYTFAVVAGLLDVLEVTDTAAARAWWVALLVGILFSLPTAATGLADWVRIESRTPLWRTATTHMVVMLLATGVFLATIIVGKSSYDDGDLTTGAFVLTLVAYGLLAVGGWAGGAIVFVHGMRVLQLVDEPAGRAMAPTGEEKAEAERG
jgi:uncharacterized membrane protein